VKAGDEVIWKHSPKGGYGYVFHIPVKILALTEETGSVLVHQRKKAKVLVRFRGGGEGVRYVCVSNLMANPSGERTEE
jgi:hypothetical protein